MGVGAAGPLPQFSPPSPDNFALLITAMVGSDDAPDEDNFDIIVCTPLWLLDRCEEQGFVLGRHHLIVHHYDWKLIDRTIRQLIENVSGDTWAEIAMKIARIGQWEFEDYVAESA